MSDQFNFQELIDKNTNELILITDEFGLIKHAKGSLKSIENFAIDYIGLPISELIVEKESPFTQPLLNKSSIDFFAFLKCPDLKKIGVQLQIQYDESVAMYLFYIRPTSIHFNENSGLEQLKDFYENLLNHLPVDVVVFSPNHRYLYINNIALSDEKKRSWLIGKTDKEYAQKYQLSPSHLNGRQETFKKVITTGKLIEYEEEFKGKQPDGSSKWVLRHFKPIYNSTGEIEFVLGFGLDISDRKKAELETLKNLEKQTELNQLKNKFVSTISHEFRTPLATIKGSIDLLAIFLEKNQIENPKINQYINTINNEVHNLNTLLNDVLMIGRHDVSQTPICFTKSNLLLLLENMIEQNFGFLVNRKIKILKQSPIEDLEIDSKLMFHVFSNILSNAVKYSQNDINLYISQNTHETTVVVEDFGIGIPTNEQSKLFNSFYRASNSIHFQGTGLGLVIIKNFVDLHHGSIELESHLDVGTLFKVSIPNFQNGQR